MNKELIDFSNALHYLKVAELEDICENLKLPTNGTKLILIERVVAFISIGKIILLPEMPAISKAQKGGLYPLAPETKILFGVYKNDLKTREFMKKLVGPHFHFTAAGIDWLNERWFAGNPPTYQEFAHFWQKNQEEQKIKKSEPKKEWAYINFTQQYITIHPHASGQELRQAWHAERQKNVEFVEYCLEKFIAQRRS